LRAFYPVIVHRFTSDSCGGGGSGQGSQPPPHPCVPTPPSGVAYPLTGLRLKNGKKKPLTRLGSGVDDPVKADLPCDYLGHRCSLL